MEEAKKEDLQPEIISVEKVKAEEVIDVNSNPDVIQGWYDKARTCTTPETLQEFVKELLSDVRYSGDTTPHAYTAIALAALKTANKSRHGELNAEQWPIVQLMIVSAIENTVAEAASV